MYAIRSYYGSGKSVCITSIATCLAMNNSPDDLRLVMIDSIAPTY